MWDSSGARGDGVDPNPAHGPADGARVARIQETVGSASIDLVPDAAFLSSAATQFPVYLDPTMSASRTAWAMINRSYPTAPYYKWATADEGMGYNDLTGVNVKRLFWLFNTTPVNGRHILGATFSAYDTYSVYSSCPASAAELWLTGAFSGSTTWNTSPSWMSRLSSVTAVAGRTNCSPNGLRLDFDATAAVVQAARNNWSGTTLGLKAADESSNTGWKRFRADATLSVTYNTVPAAPTGMRTEYPTTSCVQGSGRPSIPNDPPVLVSRLNDADGAAGQHVQGQFELWHTGGTKIAQYNTASVTPGIDYKVQLPSLGAGTYSWRVRAYDTIDYGAYSSPWCEFTVDLTAPATPTVAANPSGQSFAVGSVGTFTAGNGGSTDVTRYRWSLNSDAPTSGYVLASSPTFSVTFITFGPNNYLRVWSYDAAGNLSPIPAALPLAVSGGSPAGQWMLDEGSGMSAADATAAAHPMTLSGGYSWTTGDLFNSDPTDLAVSFDGMTGVAATAATNIVRTDQNFSVSAWVRPTDDSARHVFLSEDSGSGSGFTLGLLPAGIDGGGQPMPAAFAFTVANPSSPTEFVARAATSVVVGDWVHLVGVYEAGTHQMTLFVNSEAVMTVDVTIAGSAANGALRLGRAQISGSGSSFAAGDVNDVRAFSGALGQGQINTIFAHGQT